MLPGIGREYETFKIFEDIYVYMELAYWVQYFWVLSSLKYGIMDTYQIIFTNQHLNGSTST